MSTRPLRLLITDSQRSKSSRPHWWPCETGWKCAAIEISWKHKFKFQESSDVIRVIWVGACQLFKNPWAVWYFSPKVYLNFLQHLQKNTWKQKAKSPDTTKRTEGFNAVRQQIRRCCSVPTCSACAPNCQRKLLLIPLILFFFWPHNRHSFSNFRCRWHSKLPSGIGDVEKPQRQNLMHFLWSFCASKSLILILLGLGCFFREKSATNSVKNMEVHVLSL